MRRHSMQFTYIINKEEQHVQMQRILEMGNIKQRILLRFIILSLVSMAFLIYRFVYIPNPTPCIHDAWHQFTNQLNQGLDKYGRDNIVIGIGQVFMDFWIIVLCIFWFIKIKNSRIAFAAGLVFAIRGIMLSIMQFPFPEHIVWHNPGFISLTVPYDPTRDFFFSGHTASLTIIILQFYTLGYRWITTIPVICLIYMMNMLLITRVHYTIDIGGGLCYAFFLHQLASKYCFYSDWIFSLPYFIVNKIIQKYRQLNSKKQVSLHPLTDKMLQHSEEK